MKSSIKLFLIIVMVALIISGCTSGNDSVDTSEEAETIEDNETDETESSSDPETQEDDALETIEESEKILEEHENVESVMVQLESIDGKDFVNADITLTREVDGEEAAKEFAELLKERYSDRIIDLILIYDGDVLYQGTFE